jgi:hypothetical protein
MATHLHRSIGKPIRTGLSWDEVWQSNRDLKTAGSEVGRGKVTDPELAALGLTKANWSCSRVERRSGREAFR